MFVGFIVLVFSLLTTQVAAQGDSVAAKNVDTVKIQDTTQKDSLVGVGSIEKIQDTTQKDSLVEKTPFNQAHVSTPRDSVAPKTGIDEKGLVNILLTGKNIRTNGWGEYQVRGKCLCCDNMVDGDCLIVFNTERTEKERISYLIDGNTEGDIKDRETYFGDLKQRERNEFVSLLLVEISIPKMRDIRKVIVYPVKNTDNKMNYLSNCELGYYDQFSRLQWVEKVESTKSGEPITFTLDKPILTKKILLRVKDGRSKITEVGIFAENKTNEK